MTSGKRDPIRSETLKPCSKKLGRDYKNVHTDVRRLEQVGLVDRDKDDKVKVPWTIVEAKLRLLQEE